MKNKAKSIDEAKDIILDEIADFIQAEMVKNLIANGTPDTGFLMRSIRKEVSKDKRKIIIDAPYADFIEYGTRPHPVSPKHLVDWAHRKLNLSKEEAEKAAIAIANKIRKEGTEPQPFVRPAIDAALSKYGGSGNIKEIRS